MSTAMKPVDELDGRQLDAAVAKEVMGVCLLEGCGTMPVYRFGDDDIEAYCNNCGRRVPYAIGGEKGPPSYSTNIADAWRVVGKVLVENEKAFNLVGEAGSGFAAKFFSERSYQTVDASESAPLAICRAALKAVRER